MDTEKMEREILEKMKLSKQLKTVIEKYTEKLWSLKEQSQMLEAQIREAKELLGKWKMERCGVARELKRPWGLRYSCEARDLEVNYFSYTEILTRLCWKCKWTPEQAQTRAFMLKVRGKRDV
ncbi:MAG: hypothetical protein OH337_04110 [Candidatus Parvarchaeota archaeon]|nr:hypothetical protein [Candidatus Haiyanarchaeum thermophilum]